MTLGRYDRRLTAYALGELDEAERREVEALLAEDDAARQAVEEIRQLAGVLTDELAAEPAPELKHEERQALASARKPRRRIRLWVPLTSAAAAAVVVGGILWILAAVSGPVIIPPSSEHAHVEILGSPAPRFSQTGGTLYLSGTGERLKQSQWSTREGEAMESTQPGESFMQTGGYVGPDLGEVRLAVKNPAPQFTGTPKNLKSRNLPPGKATQATPLGGGMFARRAGIDDVDGRLDGHTRPGDPRWGPSLETYAHFADNAFRTVADHPLSTMSIDVDTAAYSNMRRFLTGGQLPPPGAVRIEELVNYFVYDYAPPNEKDTTPFAVHADIASCPWEPAHRLARIGIKGREIAPDKRPPSNFVFLLDVSGSMRSTNKLPLVKQAMKLLVQQLGENDQVAIAVYAGAAGLVLDSTTCDRKEVVLDALARLNAGGSTNGGQGIRLAYNVAASHFLRGGVNRVILCTDGDFNVGTTTNDELVRLIQDKAKTGVHLSVMGFGMGNYKDDRLEQLADKGNGNYGYIDNETEARKVFVEQMTGTLVTIAKDVKIQIEFNPTQVAAYRMIGYENRVLAKEDFNDDTKDAGEIGAGHTVTALFELVPTGMALPDAKVDPLKYQATGGKTVAAASDETMSVKLRYKKPDGDKSTLVSFPVSDRGMKFDKASEDFKFAASVASFGMILRNSKHRGLYTLAAAAELGESGVTKDLPEAERLRRREFIDLVNRSQPIYAATRKPGPVDRYAIQPIAPDAGATEPEYIGTPEPKDDRDEPAPKGVELNLKLPERQFRGTPKNLRSGNLPPKSVKAEPKVVLVPKGTKNVSHGKPVTSSDEFPILGELEQITDGDKEGVDGSFVELGPGLQWVQIDLKEPFAVHAIAVWHYHAEPCVMRDVIVQVSDDKDFVQGVRTVFNNDHDNSAGLGVGKQYEWIETNVAKVIETKGVGARYVRLYSSGGTMSDQNPYTEVEVFATPAKATGKTTEAPKAKVAAADEGLPCDVELKIEHPARTHTGCGVSIVPAKAASTATDAPKSKAGAENKGASNTVELKLELPRAQLAPTPKNLRSANLPKKPLPAKRVMVPVGTKNVARGKTVTSSDEYPIIGELEQVTDGDKESIDGSFVELGPQLQWVQIDLKGRHAIHAIALWHHFSPPSVFRDVIVQVSDDKEFIEGVRTVFNNDHDNSAGLGVGKQYEWIGTDKGKVIEAGGVQARYVRLYSNGSTSSAQNPYIEVEVYGKVAE